MFFATAKQMAKLDDLAVKNGLTILQMMELAGWRMIRLFEQLKIPRSSKVVVLCGKGNNGGDGLAAARHLINYGHQVKVILATTELNDNAEHQLKLLRKMKLPIALFAKSKPTAREAIKRADIIIDSLIGYNLSGAPRGEFAELITQVNHSGAQVLAYDLPSGMSAEGNCYEPCVKADYTLTLALPKTGFRSRTGKAQSGQIFVADIGIPGVLYNHIKIGSRPRFNLNGLVKLS